MTRSRGRAIAVSGVVLVAALLALVLVLAAGSGDGATDGPAGAGSAGSTSAAADPGCDAERPEVLEIEVVRTLPHDPDAYTQGLVVHEGRLFESTGLEGASTVREVDLDSGEVLARVPLDPDEFGEGLTVTEEGLLVQLTWLDGVAHVWDPDGLERVTSFEYPGEGWGLTTLDDGTLVQSDGSGTLTRRDAQDFEELSVDVVRRVGGDADRLNELEFDGESLWANRYQTDELLRIDPDCAVVTGVADLAALRSDAEATAAESGTRLDVPNGIAHLPGTDRYLLTGKWWPTMYEVRIT